MIIIYMFQIGYHIISHVLQNFMQIAEFHTDFRIGMRIKMIQKSTAKFARANAEFHKIMYEVVLCGNIRKLAQGCL